MRLNDRKITLDGVFKQLHNIFIDLWLDCSLTSTVSPTSLQIMFLGDNWRIGHTIEA